MLDLRPGVSLGWFPNQEVTLHQHRIQDRDRRLTQDKALILEQDHTGVRVFLVRIPMYNPARVQSIHSMHLVQCHLSIHLLGDIIHISLVVPDNEMFLTAHWCGLG